VTLHIRHSGEWLQVPLPPPVTDEIVFHYTTAIGLLGIISSDELWASSALALNDLSEITYGLDVLREAADGRKDTPGTLLQAMLEEGTFDFLRGGAYFLSASLSRDSLTQWVGYAGQQGYALGIDTSCRLAPRALGNSTSANTPDFTNIGASGWRRVVYQREAQLTAVREVLDFCNTHKLLQEPLHAARNALNFFGTLLPQFKHPSFTDEREVRFISDVASGAKEYYRTGRFGVVPYTKLIVAREDEYMTSTSKGLKLPLRELIVGPANADESPLIVATVDRMLRGHNYESVSVQPSSVPYRF
jgi:hypothetical protein